MNYTYLLSVITCILVTPLCAGEFRTLCFFGAGKAGHVYHLENASVVETELPPKNLSEPYKFTPGKPILFGKPHPEKPGKLVPFLKVTPPEGAKDLILLFFPTNNAKSPLRVITINASRDQFKGGEIMFFNVSGKTISGAFGNTKIIIHKGKSRKITAPKPLNENGDYYVFVRSREKRDGGPSTKASGRQITRFDASCSFSMIKNTIRCA